jgi:predicted MFS family arabinose efflux permease
MNKISKNIQIDYLYRFLSSFDITSAIWVLYLGFNGMSLVEIGLLEGIFHITGLISEVPTGVIADLLGRKKTIVISRLFSLISAILMLFSSTFLGFAVSFIFSALSYNLQSGSEEALVYDSLKILNREDEYLTINGRLNLIIEVSSALAVFIGGFLSKNDFKLSYIAAVLVSLCAFSVALRFKEAEDLKEESKENKKIDVKKHFVECVRILKSNKRILNYLTFFSCIYAFSATTYFYNQQYLSDNGYSRPAISIILLINGLISSLGAVLSSKIYKRYKIKAIASIPVFLSIFIFIIGYSKENFILLTLWIINFFTAILQPISSNLINSMIKSEQRATILSLESMFYSLSMIILFPISGCIGDLFSLETSFRLLGIISLLLSLIEFFIIKKNK